MLHGTSSLSDLKNRSDCRLDEDRFCELGDKAAHPCLPHLPVLQINSRSILRTVTTSIFPFALSLSKGLCASTSSARTDCVDCGVSWYIDQKSGEI